MQGTIRPSKRWLQRLGAVALFAMSSPALSVVPLDCTGITGSSAAGTCTLNHSFTISTNHFVLINENLVIDSGGVLAYGNAPGTLNVTGNLTVNAGGSITALGGASPNQNGGALTITVGGNATVNGSIAATGAAGTGVPTAAGKGGTLALGVTGAANVSGSVSANGGATGPVVNAGGDGGSVTITASSLNVSGAGTVAANGANGKDGTGNPATAQAGSAGGAGGSVSVSVTGDLYVGLATASILANGGNGGKGKDEANGNAGGNGAAGGTAGVIQLAVGGDFIDDGAVSANAGKGGAGGNGGDQNGAGSDNGGAGGSGAAGGSAASSVPNGVAISALSVDIGETGLVSADGGRGGSGGAGGTRTGSQDASTGNGGAGGVGSAGGTAGAVKITPICETVDVMADGSEGTISAVGGAGGFGGSGGGRAGKGSGNGGNGANAGNGSNGGAITIESDGIQTYTGTLTAAKGLAGEAGSGGTRTSTSGSGSNGSAGGAGSNGTDGSIHLTTSGAAIDTTDAAITPEPVKNTAHAAFCAAATHSVTLVKDLSPSLDDGKFTLKVNGTAVATDVGNTGQGTASSVGVGSTVDIAELAGTGTDLGNYTIGSITCTGVTAPSGTSSGSFTMPGNDVTCTFHNTRKTHGVTLVKDLSPSLDDGKFTLKVNGTAVATDVGNTGQGTASSVAVGSSVSIAEVAGTGTDLGNYTIGAITCSGVTAPSGTASGSFTMPDAAVTCTFHNTRKTHGVTLVKDLSPSGDGGKFTLKVNGTAVATDVGNAGQGTASSVAVGSSVSIAEVAGAGTNLGNYTIGSITCSGVTAPSGTDQGSFTMPDNDVTCTFHNTRATNPTVTATMWVGLENSDDQGTEFDVIVKLLKNGVEVASGVALCQTDITRNPNLAKAVSVTMTGPGTGTLVTNDVLKVQVFARIGTTDGVTKCSGPGGAHNNARGLRLYYDAAARASEADNLYLHSDGNVCPGSGGPSTVTNRFLDGTAPTATSAKCQDSAGVDFNGGNVAQQIGGDWTMLVP